MKLQVQQDIFDQYSNLQNTDIKTQKIQGHYSATTIEINVTKTKNMTRKWPNFMDMETDDLNSTWEYLQLTQLLLNFSRPEYFRVKLVDETPYQPKPPMTAKIIHSKTPRFNIHFKNVSSNINIFSQDYIIVSIIKLRIFTVLMHISNAVYTQDMKSTRDI